LILVSGGSSVWRRPPLILFIHFELPFATEIANRRFFLTSFAEGVSHAKARLARPGTSSLRCRKDGVDFSESLKQALTG